MRFDKLFKNNRLGMAAPGMAAPVLAALVLAALFSVSCGNADEGGNGPLSMENTKPAYMGNTIENLENYGPVTYDDNYVYYRGGDEWGTPSIYKSDHNGENTAVLANGVAIYLNVVGEWLYYVDISDWYNCDICKTSIHGGESQIISDKNAGFLLAYKDRLYFISYGEAGGNYLYSMNDDGSDVVCLSDDIAEIMYIEDDIIYMASSPGKNGPGSFFKMGLDGSGKAKICEYGYSVQWLSVHEGALYYVQGYTLTRVDIQSGKQDDIADLGEIVPGTYNIDKNSGTFYYFTMENFFGWKSKMHLLDLNTGAVRTKTMPYLIRSVSFYDVSNFIVGDNIFWVESGIFFVMDLDGSNIRPWVG